MDDNSTKFPAGSAKSDPRLRRAEFGSHHQMLLDRLTHRPAPLRPAKIAVAPKVMATPAAHAMHKIEPRRDAPASQSAPIEDRRSSPRRRMLKAGVLSFNGSFAGLRCTVRDVSETGARLQIDQFAKIPETFEFIIEIDGLYAKSCIVWRKASDAGIRFLEPARRGAKLREQVITPRS